MKRLVCSECGAELKLRPGSCPLCGADPPPAADTTAKADDYQSKVRDLRNELLRLRSETAGAA